VWWQLVGPRWACRSAGSRRASEILARTVTPRGESHCDERTDRESELVRSAAGTAQRRGACELPGTDSQRVRGRMLRRPSVAGGGFETKPDQINDLRCFGPSKPSAKLRLEIRDPVVGGGELTGAIAQVGFEDREAVAGVV